MFASLLVGVGRSALRGRVRSSDVSGVGRSAVPSRRRRLGSGFTSNGIESAIDDSAAGVGSQEEDAVTEVRGTDGCRRNAIPFRSPPARGQVSDHSSERPRKVAWNVLSEEVARSHFANDAPDLVPEPSLVIGAMSTSGHAVGLAGVAGGDEVDASAKRTTIEASEVKPDWSARQRPIFHARRQDIDGSGIPLAVSESGWGGQPEPRGGQVEAEIESGGATTEGDESHGVTATTRSTAPNAPA